MWKYEILSVQYFYYYAKIRFTGVTQETEVRYSISGYEYMVEEQKYIKNYNKSGEIKEWNNPLISKASSTLKAPHNTQACSHTYSRLFLILL